MEEQATKRHIACSICRRRKLKCDGRRPTCSTCQRLHQVCEYSEFVRKAGPKRGYVRNLESRISYLEKLLNDHHISDDPNSPQVRTAGGPDSRPRNDDLPTEEPMPSRELVMDLTEIFFLRVNIIHAVIDRKRYMSAMNQPPAHQPPPFLQYVVMASAAAITPKYYSVKQLLYERASKYLKKAEIAFSDGTPSIQYIVALGLMGHFNARENRLRVAWLDIGKAWRAIIMLSLNMVDAPTWDTKTVDSLAVAEARRAFWFIYFCDRAGTLGVALPPIINVDDVFVKLPMDDDAFLLGHQSNSECLKLEELLINPNMFTQYQSARVAMTICIVEVDYQILEMGRFPKKNRAQAANEWFSEFSHFENILQKLIRVIPLVPSVPAGGADDNKVLIEEKSRRTAHLLIYLWAQAGVLFSSRSGLHGIQQYPLILTMANPGKLVQTALMSMLEILLVTRNPHDLDVIGTHPLHPILLFALAVIILALADHNLVSLDNFRAPVEYIMKTLQELIPIMPVTEMLSDFLKRTAPQLTSDNENNVVNRVEDVLQRGNINLSLPNFLDGNMNSTENSPHSMVSPSEVPPIRKRSMDAATPSPLSDSSLRYATPQHMPYPSGSSSVPGSSVPPLAHAQQHQPKPQPPPPQPGPQQQSQRQRVSSISGQNRTPPNPSQAHVPHAPPHVMDDPRVVDLIPEDGEVTLVNQVYEEPFNDSFLDLDPQIYLPDVKPEFETFDYDRSVYDKGLEWNY